MQCECISCKRTLPDMQVHGIVARVWESVASIEAVGICHDCKLVTLYDYRLHDDMRITGLRENGWETWKTPPSLLKKVKRFWQRWVVGMDPEVNGNYQK